MRREHHEGLTFVSVPTDDVERAIEQLNAWLGDLTRTCTGCGYEARVDRWGLRTHETTDPDRTAIVLCCPSCERRADLPVETIDA